MSAHRYWRIFCHYASTGQDSTNSFSEIELRSSNGGSNLIGSGTAAASSQLNSSFTPAKAVDGNTSTMWISTNNGADAWWSYDFGSGITQDIIEIKMTPRTDGFYYETPTYFDVQYSDDDSTWTTYWTINYSGGISDWFSWQSAAARVFNNTTTMNLWRIYCFYASSAASDGVMSFAEIEFHSSIGGSNVIGSEWLNSSSELSSTFAPSKAVDGNAGTFWVSASQSADQWWGVGFASGTPSTIAEIKLTPRNDGFHAESPTHIAVQSSPDGQTWTSQWTVATAPAWSSGTAQTFSAPVTTNSQSRMLMM